MLIKETIERECCDFRFDIKPARAYGKNFKFCIHCGQLWKSVKKLDASGNWSSDFEKVQIKNE